MKKDNVTISLKRGRLEPYINGERLRDYQDLMQLTYINHYLGFTTYVPIFKGADDITDAILLDIESTRKMRDDAPENSKIRIYYHEVMRKLIDCMPIFKWMDANRNRAWEISEDDIELIDIEGM